MSRRLVIPADATSADIAWRGLTWQEVAAENQCDAIELLGSQWCTDNHVDGLGIATEYVAPPEPPPPAPQLADVLLAALESASAPMSAPDLAAILVDAIAPLVGQP